MIEFFPGFRPTLQLSMWNYGDDNVGNDDDDYCKDLHTVEMEW